MGKGLRSHRCHSSVNILILIRIHVEGHREGRHTRPHYFRKTEAAATQTHHIRTVAAENR